ncbi:MAG: molybdopterin molybdotransferase MoeA [Candidatus Omnitrophica bacterium]|nr:molybdopterin molybdotransferase MoeA [Candidatus Omnitrophota bacterium]
MISVDEALKQVREFVMPLEAIERPLSESVGYALAETIVAATPLPPFDNSAMDGYAIQTEDVARANPENPVWLRLIGEVPAGSSFERPIHSGEAVRIMTGAPVPSTADAVVKLEEARLRREQVEIHEPVPRGKHIRRKGEDVTVGETVLEKGTTIRLQHLGLLASLGRKGIKVYRGPSVSFLTTGSELVEVGEALPPGKIHNTNGLILQKLLEGLGITPRNLGTVQDDPERLKTLIQKSATSDLLLISGGVSVGKYDYVKEVLQELGMKTFFWRVAIKPGQPILFGRLNHRWVFGLPGNPISCVVCFLLFVKPAIQRMMGTQNPQHPIVHAILQKGISKSDGRRHYLTAILREENRHFVITPTGKQGSGMLASLAQANAFIVVPEERNSLETGELVDVLPF